MRELCAHTPIVSEQFQDLVDRVHSPHFLDLCAIVSESQGELHEYSTAFSDLTGAL